MVRSVERGTSRLDAVSEPANVRGSVCQGRVHDRYTLFQLEHRSGAPLLPSAKDGMIGIWAAVGRAPYGPEVSKRPLMAGANPDMPSAPLSGKWPAS
jgi:hypothetical protein